ncbi:MAG: replicative DNA helicase, partial [Candidatus Hydrogenedentales bacterium]
MPPHSLDAERSVLGAMLLNPDAVGIAIEVLREKPADVFYSGTHQHVYGAMLQLFRNNTPVDAVTLFEQLKRDGHLDEAGGPAYIADLSGAVPTSANVEYYARIVLDAAILRRLISACSRLAGEAYSQPDDVSKLLDLAEAEIFSIAEKRQLNPIYHVEDLLEDSIHRIEEIIKSRTGITGIATGFARLDEMTSGFQRSDMVVLAARPSVGKTAFVLNLAANAAIHSQKRVLLFSLEMAKEQLVQRLLCMEGAIDSRRLRTGFLAKEEFPKLQKAAGKLAGAAIYIDDTPNISVLDLRSKARRHAAVHGVDLIVIDYLQLMGGSRRSESRQVEIAEISRSIKGIARELSVPVVALSQLSREAEKDDTGTPKLSHLRESGAIEQDADVVLMLSRPPVHEREENPDLIHVTLAKQRNGPTGDFKLLFERNLQRFRNYEEAGRFGG